MVVVIVFMEMVVLAMILLFGGFSSACGHGHSDSAYDGDGDFHCDIP